MRTTLRLTVTVESNVGDCYDLRDSLAAAFLGVKQTWLSETDDAKIEFQIVEVIMPGAGRYEFIPTRRSAPPYRSNNIGKSPRRSR